MKYASINDLINIFKAVFVSSVIVTIIVIVRPKGLIGFPRSVFFIDPVFLILLIGGARFINRLYRERAFMFLLGQRRKVLIVGAGDAGNAVLKEIGNNPKLDYNVVGFVDDNQSKIGLNLQGVPVLGSTEDIKDIVKKNKIEEIILAIPSATRQQMEAIISECEKTKVKIKTIPAIGDLIDGTVSFSQIKEVQIEDLLGRDVVNIDTGSIKKYLEAKVVLVTGAGGSIGSEICRQLVRFKPAAIVLLGRGENSIYQIHKELSGHGVKLYQVIGDVINKKKLEGVFKKYKPQVVFHAAADKHIHLLEYNPDEGVLNNIIGTKNLVEVCDEFNTEKLVSISTDKAADPQSILGYTKRISEILLSSRKNASVRALSVRFGNVLGSRGSVIPLFREQIKKGGPVTVTHKDMTRYFMTIPEASQLVLQAGVMGAGGEIFLLDMGSPVRIAVLAEKMIKLSGFEPGTDIPIVFTGVRPGEKLTEILTGKYETLTNTGHPKIFMVKQNAELPNFSESDFDDLKQLAITMDTDGILRKLREMLSMTLPRS
jgi:FlaA1/EpsC-like NDP-sugar epimerase